MIIDLFFVMFFGWKTYSKILSPKATLQVWWTCPTSNPPCALETSSLNSLSFSAFTEFSRLWCDGCFFHGNLRVPPPKSKIDTNKMMGFLIYLLFKYGSFGGTRVSFRGGTSAQCQCHPLQEVAGLIKGYSRHWRGGTLRFSWFLWRRFSLWICTIFGGVEVVEGLLYMTLVFFLWWK